MGINVPEDFLGMASEFLNCRVGRTPFKYLGLPVGANPRKLSTWEPMLNVIKGRLCAWGNKYVSLGGRIVLINAVMNAIPIFYLSYMKMPLKVWRELVKLQRVFLWAGLSKQTKTCWVKWDVICKPKKEGGLGVRDLRLVNISLLAKWRWKLLTTECEVWKEVVGARYGRDVIGKVNLGDIDVTRTGSCWWRDLCLLDSDVRWFSSAVGKRVGRGDSTMFWNEIWIGDQPLRQRFPRLFGMSTQQNEVICNMGSLVNGLWHWELQWRRNFFTWEEDQYNHFLDIIVQFAPTVQQDRWLWLGDGVQGYTANSAYSLVVNKLVTPSVCDPINDLVFKILWKCGAPSKVSAFSWQLMLDRLQTKDNLMKRRIIQAHHGNCVFCNLAQESASHLFLHCDRVAKVWYDLMRWLGLTVILPHNIVSSLAILVTCANNKKERAGLCLIWNAYMWVIWTVRNVCVFNNGVFMEEEVADQVKLESWKWFIGRVAKGPCMLYEWRWSPLDCLMR
ncbi:hypothetical protein TSUD_395930 [Trifolium subterraneum]|uniref:Reverse transcriptase zinc-binding domain-containing protein n=1 Tax=Trifolium subterraneum TaxID=3900 RepID=A0A2Z6MZY5_TRISU|nr:hypothetical protein TSUD_395930 [Trifolium subterraneum]